MIRSLGRELRQHAEGLYGSHDPGIGCIVQFPYPELANGRSLVLSHPILFRKKQTEIIASLVITTPALLPLSQRNGHLEGLHQQFHSLSLGNSLAEVRLLSTGQTHVSTKREGQAIPDELYYLLGGCMLDCYQHLEEVRLSIPRLALERHLNGEWITRGTFEPPANHAPTI